MLPVLTAPCLAALQGAELTGASAAGFVDKFMDLEEQYGPITDADGQQASEQEQVPAGAAAAAAAAVALLAQLAGLLHLGNMAFQTSRT